jgi:hypothetical protein
MQSTLTFGVVATLYMHDIVFHFHSDSRHQGIAEFAQFPFYVHYFSIEFHFCSGAKFDGGFAYA